MTLRRIIASHPAALAVLLAATLLLRLLVPAGFMPAVSAGGFRLVVCSGVAEPAKHAAAMPGMAHHGGTDEPAPAHPEMPCAFAGLGLAVLGAAEVVILALALAFATVLAQRRRRPIPARTPRRLRPPPHAPPRLA